LAQAMTAQCSAHGEVSRLITRSANPTAEGRWHRGMPERTDGAGRDLCRVPASLPSCCARSDTCSLATSEPCSPRSLPSDALAAAAQLAEEVEAISVQEEQEEAGGEPADNTNNSHSVMSHDISSCTLTREDEDSIMGMVRDRMAILDSVAGTHDPAEDSCSRTHTRTSWPPSECSRANSRANTWARTSGDSLVPSSTGISLKSVPQKSLASRKPRGLSLWMTMAVSIAMSVIIACTLVFVLLYINMVQMHSDLVEPWDDFINMNRLQIQQTTQVTTQEATTHSLRQVTEHVLDILVYPNRALDALWGHLRVRRTFGGGGALDAAAASREVTYRAWMELVAQRQEGDCATHAMWRQHEKARRPSADYLYVGYATGELAGAALLNVSRAEDESAAVESYAMFFEAKGASRSLEITTIISNLSLPLVATKTSLETVSFEVTGRPWYMDQAASAGSDRQAVRIWSRPYEFSTGVMGITLSAPLAHCGSYACFEGAIGSDIDLSSIGTYLEAQWTELRSLLRREPYHFSIGPDNSTIFIVNHVAERFGDQEGILMGVSGRRTGPGLNTLAINSPDMVVKETARAILAKYGTWGNDSLRGETSFNYAVPDLTSSCELVGMQFDAVGCKAVATQSVLLQHPLDDKETRWLVVVAIPAGAFGSSLAKAARVIQAQARAREEDAEDVIVKLRTMCVVLFLVMILVSLSTGLVIGRIIATPLKNLGALMQHLGDLDFSNLSETAEFQKLANGRHSPFLDLSQLQLAFCRLVPSVEAFSRFVPETVVRNIVQGEEKASRLHVERKEVTILFSDIKDFTSISEKLTQKNLLLILTRYLSIMTRIVELCDGVVAEILGDGLLVFWNTPDTIEDHPTKACLAALAMQQALGPLNNEFRHVKLPNLAIRIGIHTGTVLTGNIGSDKKMKFGCMGDPMNLASRLEGLCKYYGVGVLVSGSTREAVLPSWQLFFRKLDLVMVKGRKEPTWVYELCGREADAAPEEPHNSGNPVLRRSPTMHDDEDSPIIESTSELVLKALRLSSALASSPDKREKSARSTTTLSEHRTAPGEDRQIMQRSLHTSTAAVTPERRLQAEQYERALLCFQEGRFGEAVEVADALVRDAAEDTSAKVLLARAREKAASPMTSAERDGWTGVSIMTDK